MDDIARCIGKNMLIGGGEKVKALNRNDLDGIVVEWNNNRIDRFNGTNCQGRFRLNKPSPLRRIMFSDRKDKQTFDDNLFLFLWYYLNRGSITNHFLLLMVNKWKVLNHRVLIDGILFEHFEVALKNRNFSLF